jgi:prepilin-type N-terminal cleavage/methylation domain-containing protein
MTLVEMMVVLAIFAVVMTVIISFLVQSRRSYSDMSQRVEYQQAVRATLTLLSREIRSAGCDPLNAGFDRFPVANEDQLRFRMDLDGDGAIEIVEPAEDVQYVWQAAQQELTRDSGSGAQTILRNVTGLNFSYFDADGAPLGPPPLPAADRARIRYVEIAITGESDRGESLSYTTRVLVRNG